MQDRHSNDNARPLNAWADVPHRLYLEGVDAEAAIDGKLKMAGRLVMMIADARPRDKLSMIQLAAESLALSNALYWREAGVRHDLEQ